MGYLDGSLKHAHADTCDTLHPRLSFSLVCVPEPEARPKIGIVTLMRPFHGNHSPARGGPQHRRRRLREIHRHEIFRVIRKRKNPRTRPRVTAADIPWDPGTWSPDSMGAPGGPKSGGPKGASDLTPRQHYPWEPQGVSDQGAPGGSRSEGPRGPQIRAPRRAPDQGRVQKNLAASNVSQFHLARASIPCIVQGLHCSRPRWVQNQHQCGVKQEWSSYCVLNMTSHPSLKTLYGRNARQDLRFEAGIRSTSSM